ncbi:BofC C-terminal domain-containing protein [Peribacillus sp. SCS-26]|uniref:BofC C-terminal domain-containing protein n=1 Tax=Paraperibacillus marinus TaxID=3115295 RepID=UPI0039061BAA
MKKYLFFLLCLLGGFCHGASSSFACGEDVKGNIAAGASGHSLQNPQMREVILQRVYVDGDVSEEKIKERIWSMEDFFAQYTGWELVAQNKKQIILKKPVNDISPLLKSNGYFGLSDGGTLSIFNGRPREYRIIQSFFQLDMRKLEGSRQRQLTDGIKISDRQQYNEVIETFKSYSK